MRPTVFMHLWVGLIGDPIVKSGKATVFGRGDNPINFVFEGDVAQFVVLALCDPQLRGLAIEVGGPENFTLNELVRHVETAAGRTARVRYVPVPLMRLSRLLMKRFRPDMAGLIEAGIVFDTFDMRFDATSLRKRCPQVELHCLAEILRRRFG